MEAINISTPRQKWNSLKKRPASLILFLAVWVAAIIVSAIILIIVGYVLIKGIPHLKPSLFEWEYTTKNVSMMPAIINTVSMTFLSLIMSVPIGIFSAIYLVEYAKTGSRFVKFIRTTTETLTGIPSIVYGQFGFLIFVIACGFKNSMLSGALTLSIMILPSIMRTTEEALLSVPTTFREGSFGLGAGRLRTVFRVVLPSAVPGILSGIILAIGRIVGETAALIYTSGTVAGIPKDIFSSGRTLSVHMYALTSEGLYMNEAYATAVVILAVVLIINTISEILAKKMSAKKG
ncbi:MAG: phosphate ABC transporter permease PstA [Lachnospiraceae bacterium]|nr:phosphate ABC transporter permease PstA [Lachnospiraceae bacterium]